MRLLLSILLLCGAVPAQTLSGVSGSASRTVTFTADEAAIGIAASTGLDGTEQQVKQILQDAGLPNPTVVMVSVGAGNFAYLPPGPLTGQPQVFYQATVTIPAGSAKDAVKSLEALRVKPPDPLKTLQYSVAFNASQASIDAMRQVVQPQLVAEAEKKAAALAAAAGVKLGAIRSISDAAGGAMGATYAFIAQFLSPVLLPPNTGYGTQYTFSVNVAFDTVQ